MRRTLGLVAVLVAACGLAWFLASGHPSFWQLLASRRGEAASWVGSHPASAPLLFVLAYIVAAALCLPGASVLTMAGGLLFGTVPGAAASILGATAGAVALFVVARTLMAGWLDQRLGGRLAPLRAGLDRDGFSYVLALRLIPAFPFWLVNLAPALAGMRLAPFALATAIGIVPGSLVFASIGASLDGAILAGGEPKLTPALLLPLAGLGLLSLLPVVWKRFRPSHAT